MVAVRRKGREDRKGRNQVVQVHTPSLVSYTFRFASRAGVATHCQRRLHGLVQCCCFSNFLIKPTPIVGGDPRLHAAQLRDTVRHRVLETNPADAVSRFLTGDEKLVS